MKATNYEARAWLLRNRQKLESARKESAQKLPQHDDRDSFCDGFVLEVLCGPMGRVMP